MEVADEWEHQGVSHRYDYTDHDSVGVDATKKADVEESVAEESPSSHISVLPGFEIRLDALTSTKVPVRCVALRRVAAAAPDILEIDGRHCSLVTALSSRGSVPRRSRVARKIDHQRRRSRPVDRTGPRFRPGEDIGWAGHCASVSHTHIHTSRQLPHSRCSLFFFFFNLWRQTRSHPPRQPSDRVLDSVPVEDRRWLSAAAESQDWRVEEDSSGGRGVDGSFGLREKEEGRGARADTEETQQERRSYRGRFGR